MGRIGEVLAVVIIGVFCILSILRCGDRSVGNESVCGNGDREREEPCDGNDLANQTCQTLGFTTGELSCTAECTLDTSDCTTCGNEVREAPDEECDGQDVGPETCLSLGYHGGGLRCNEDCTYDLAECEQAGWCEDSVVQTNEECDDGNDVEWDGCTGCEITEFEVTRTDLGGGEPAVAMASDGNYAVVWNGGSIVGQRSGPDGVPLGEWFVANTVKQYGIPLQTVAVQRPAIATDGIGNFVLVWEEEVVSDGNTQYGGIYGRLFNPDATPATDEFMVNTNTGSSQWEAAVAMSADGAFIVAWRDGTGAFDGLDGSESGVFARRYNSDASPLGDQFQVNSTAVSEQELPAVAMGNTGAFMIVWQSDHEAGVVGVYGRAFDSNGDPVANEFPLSTVAASFQRYPSVASTSDSTFLAVWAGPGPLNGEGIWARRFDSAGNSMDVEEFQINSDSVSGIRPSVAVMPSGAFVVAWEAEVNTSDDIFVRQYDSTAAPIGLEFQVNKYTFAEQWLAAVAIDETGRLIVAWQSRTNLGWRVDAQRYDAQGNALGVLPW